MAVPNVASIWPASRSAAAPRDSARPVADGLERDEVGEQGLALLARDPRRAAELRRELGAGAIEHEVGAARAGRLVGEGAAFVVQGEDAQRGRGLAGVGLHRGDAVTDGRRGRTAEEGTDHEPHHERDPDEHVDASPAATRRNVDSHLIPSR